MTMSKYGNIMAGNFSSKLEKATYDFLLLREKCGEIKDIQCQDHVYLTKARIHCIPDFKFFDIKTQKHWWAEAKGFEAPRWPTIQKLWEFYGPGPLEIYKGSYRKVELFKTIYPKL